MGVDGIDERIAAGARAIASALRGPAGQVPLDRIVIDHLAWFDLCQQRGMTWPQMGRLLQKASAGRESGLPFSSGHLSSVVWRQRQKSRDEQAAAPISPAQPIAAIRPSEMTPPRSEVSPTRVTRTARSPVLDEKPNSVRGVRKKVACPPEKWSSLK